MTTVDLLREALRSLLSHRLRSALASIGAAAGVAAILAAMAIGEGARRQALADIGLLGMDNVVIRALAARDPRGRPGSPILTLDDVDALSRRMPGVTVAAMRATSEEVTAGNRRAAATVAGVTASWRATGGLSPARGRWFDVRSSRARVAVLGDALRRELFGAGEPIGERILAAGEWRTVVGVLAPAADPRSTRAATDALDTDRAIFLPIGSMDLALGAGDRGDAVQRIVARVSAGADVSQAANAISAHLMTRHQGAAVAFETIVPRELLRARLRAQRTSQLTMFAFGAVALIISGVGIANIMAASVAERAAEIGVRRAVGARRRAILAQFAIEALLLSVAGAAAGLAFGVLGAAAAARLGGWPMAVSAGSVVIATGVAGAVGLAAGLYPARMAASLSPIEALRG